jgi:hypothetical protein
MSTSRVCICVLRIVVALQLICLVGCRPKGPSNQSEWDLWFDRTFAELPKWDVPSSVAVAGQIVGTPDGVEFRLEPEYHQRNENGCWDKLQGTIPNATLLRDICVHRITPYIRPGFVLKPQQASPGVADQVVREAWQAGAARLNGRRIIVERALATGGYQGRVRRWESNVLVEVQRGALVLVSGISPEEPETDVFIQIASTIEVRDKQQKQPVAQPPAGGSRSP